MTEGGDEDGGAYEYDPYDMEHAKKGDYHSGDQCPACGLALRIDTIVMNESGDRGEVLDLAEEDVSVPLWHPDCWREHSSEIRGLDNTSLSDF